MFGFALAAFGLPLLGLVAADHAIYTDSNYQEMAYGLYPNQNYTSNPDVNSPIFQVNTNATDDAQLASHVFISPRGTAVSAVDNGVAPMIFDSSDLSLVWANSSYGQTFGIRVQEYKNENYITFWSGKPQSQGYGRGYYIMLDSSYNIAYNLTAKNVSVLGDMHEFQLTDAGTALITVYEPMSYNLTSYGIEDGWIVTSIFQEIDIATNDLIFSWSSIDYFNTTTSYADPGSTGDAEDNPYDYFHINSIEKDSEGNYLISSRHCHMITYINGTDGTPIWTLGGKLNDFEDLSDGNATNFAWQHDARWYGNSNTVLTVFDNGAADWVDTENATRGLRLELDYDAMTVTLQQDYLSPDGILSESQGSVQPLDNGNVFMGYGNNAAFTEYKHDGTVVWDVQFGIIGNASVQSYRAYKMNWTAYPAWDPSIASKDGSVYVSWNGATEVKSWALLASNETMKLNNATDLWKEVTRDGFETSVDVEGQYKYVRAAALDSKGNVLGASDVVEVKIGNVTSASGNVTLSSSSTTSSGSGAQQNALPSATSTAASSSATSTQTGAASLTKAPIALCVAAVGMLFFAGL
ncbi:hypothetical protein M8818_007243 [Zalaria obscura]|uniref:Uncharacterized protein n=1 Tax=Zalaria obscura TaxID=2024903 RepID=A0ACC3S689_9PEZI